MMLNILKNVRLLFAPLLFTSFSLFNSPTLAATTTWQGPYGGLYLGGGFGNSHASTNAGTVTSTSYFTSSADINSVSNAGTWRKNPNNVIGGIQAGHDWVWKQMVYGVALDYGAMSLSSSRKANNVYASTANIYSIYTSVHTNWLFTLRGRLAYPAMLYWPSLFYVTGGMAMAQLTVKNNFSDNASIAGLGGNQSSENQIGWTAGAGIELAALKHASVFLEYLYVHIPSVKTSSTISNSVGGFGIPPQSLTNPFQTTGNMNANLVKLGVNYRFNES